MALDSRELHDLKDIVILERNSGNTYANAFRIAAKKLRKSEDECKNLWYNKLHIKYGHLIDKTKKRGKADRVLSSGQVVLGWKPQEDDILLQHIREAKATGKPISHAMEEAAKSLPGRTTKACSRRYYIVLKDNLDVDTTNTGDVTVVKEEVAGQQVDNTPISFPSPIQLLNDLHKHIKGTELRVRGLEKQNAILIQENAKLKDQVVNSQELKEANALNETLQVQLDKANKQYIELKEDYKAMLNVFDKARKQIVEDEMGPSGKPKFTMEKNGNLEPKRH